MKKLKLTFIADKNITAETLHSLYTSIRFKEDKKEVDENFKVWSEGRSAFIIIDEDKIENDQEQFLFITHDQKQIKIKLMRKQNLTIQNEFKSGDQVSVFSVLSHSKKHFTDLHENKMQKGIEYCVLDIMSKFKKGEKQDFLNYLTKETGLDFVEAEKNKTVKFERIMSDEQDIFNNSVSKKVAIRNIIAINADKIKVIEEDKVNSLSFRQIGKRKSFGFGNVSIESCF